MTAIKNNARKTRTARKVATKATVEVTNDDTNAILDALNATDAQAALVNLDYASQEIAPLDDAAPTLRDMVNMVTVDEIKAKRLEIEVAFADRDGFEKDGALSYAKAKKDVLKNINNVARLLCALNVHASFINRVVNTGNRFNAKALHKVSEIASFACGDATRVQKITQAFVLCSMFYSEKENAIIGNKVNKQFLSNASFDKMVKDSELADYIREYQHKFISGGKDTQSSQVRNVLDALNVARIVSVERARGGIEIFADHAFYGAFRDRYLKA